eukprot:7170177-Prorocentrum_lima.AAC.1
MVQDPEGEFTMAGTLCGIPLRQQHPEALIHDPGGPFAMWTPALPMTSSPRSARGISTAVGRLA